MNRHLVEKEVQAVLNHLVGIVPTGTPLATEIQLLPDGPPERRDLQASVHEISSALDELDGDDLQVLARIIAWQVMEGLRSPLYTVHRTTVGYDKYEVRIRGQQYSVWSCPAGSVPAADNPSLDKWADVWSSSHVRPYRQAVRDAMRAGTVRRSYV